MGPVSKKKPEPAEGPAPGPFNPAFAALSKLKEAMPEPPPAAPDAPVVRRPGDSALERALAEKLVIQRERKGHGGKTMTRVRGLALPAKALEALAKELKRGLGCGALVEDGEVLVQGDQADRVADWLKKRGAKKVVLGN